MSDQMKLQINDQGSWRNVCTLDNTAEATVAVLKAARELFAVLPERVSFRLWWPNGVHTRIERDAKAH